MEFILKYDHLGMRARSVSGTVFKLLKRTIRSKYHRRRGDASLGASAPMGEHVTECFLGCTGKKSLLKIKL